MCSTFGRSALQKLRSVTDLLNVILTKKVQHGAAFKAYFPICVTDSLNLTHVGNTMLEKSLHLFGEHFLSKRCSFEKHCVANVSQESPKVMFAKDKQKERAKVPMCVTDWVTLKLETGGGGHSWKANPEIVFKLGGMFK